MYHLVGVTQRSALASATTTPRSATGTHLGMLGVARASAVYNVRVPAIG